MQGLGLALWAVAIMAALNVTIVVLTLGVKGLRSLRRARTKVRNRRLETMLYGFLDEGRLDPGLYRIDRRDAELLAILMVEHLSLLRGAERDRLVELAQEIGLVEKYFVWLKARNRWRKARAAENLGYFGGPAAVTSLARLLSHPDETVRAVSARALARIGTPEAAEALARTLNDTSELTRLRMAENLERLGSLATEPLLEALEKGQPQAQVLSVRILGNLRAAEAGPSLRGTMLASDSVDVRAQAALSLGKIGNPEDVPALQTAAEDEGWPVRAQVANALGMIGDDRAIPTLRGLISDEEWWVRLNASRALANMGLAGETVLTEVLEGEDDFASSRAAATLQERGIVRRIVGELADPGERGVGARTMVRAMARAGAVRYLERLFRSLPEGPERVALARTLEEARDL